ncbi:transposase [Oleiphilus messinensis]|uniref:Transposase n=1 Tax=Oleiphilus messinensis TaxID=141451 RepID=A0A1Y0IIK2_9GAMM|nr:transposase [Oleiphilus messinensis]ARU59355.1 transposase [Oleiphilus messinensis]
MPKPRKAQISLDATPYYHCISRCVRRSFLCGVDHYTGKSYEHRRQWVEDRLILLARTFAIDVCAFAVMSNHTHTVLRINQAKAESWSTREVIERWHGIYAGNALSKRYLSGDTLLEFEQHRLNSLAKLWRARLQDISWFMRSLNEPIARAANQEDQCTGRFWEGRFKCQALLDEQALAACLAYVDLNPIRAGIADSPESSDHTSVQKRIRAAKTDIPHQPDYLLPFVGKPRKDQPDGLQFNLQDYLELVDWTGRIQRDDKRGSISTTLPPILKRLNINEKQWTQLTGKMESLFPTFVGKAERVEIASKRLGHRRVFGLAQCRSLFST